MPSYELALILKTMSKPELIATLMRAGEGILQRGGIIRHLENLGTKELPFRMRAHNQSHMKGSYFIFHFESSPTIIDDLKDLCLRDIDVVRPSIVLTSVKAATFTCTLDEELKPPAYRPSVQELLKHKYKRGK